MKVNNELREKYYEWLCEFIFDKYHFKRRSYDKLIRYLFHKRFYYILEMDENRSEDGLYLRRQFADQDWRKIGGDCSVLEMMIALAYRCEDIMSDLENDHTSKWFWMMIENLGLGEMSDENFSKIKADEIICRLLERNYEPDGTGSLFTVQHRPEDMRDVEIWYQMCWYLDTII